MAKLFKLPVTPLLNQFGKTIVFAIVLIKRRQTLDGWVRLTSRENHQSIILWVWTTG